MDNSERKSPEIALVSYATLTESRVEIALRHLGHVVLVEELTLVSLLAQASQPMLGRGIKKDKIFVAFR